MDKETGQVPGRPKQGGGLRAGWGGGESPPPGGEFEQMNGVAGSPRGTE